MVVHSPQSKASTSRDPYELERLAEELVARELSKPSSSSTPFEDSEEQDSTVIHELPLHVPLSHDNPFLAADTFNVEEFLLSRSHTSLHDLRSELRDYLSTLKEELVKLINDDYEAFISLSTDLRGEGTRLERLRTPLGALKAQILESKSDLQVIQDSIQGKLQKRAVLREETALLHLLLKISDSVSRLESLLLIASPLQDASATSPQDIHGSKMPSHLSTVEDEHHDTRSRDSRAKHLARVAAEYTQLLYHTSKARAEKCVFVDEIQWRIDRIQSTLSSDLDHLFASTLHALTDGKGEGRATEMDKAKWTADLTECLRTYDILGLWRDAEDVLRRELVRGFVKKTIYSGALAAPHSPILPHTPIVAPRSHFPPPLTASHPPRTPYTPFTAFASKQNPFEISFGGSSRTTSTTAYLLDDEDDSLARLYNQILRFVERDLSRIMDLAEKVSIKSVSNLRGDKGMLLASSVALTTKEHVASKSHKEGFEIMANVVWAEVGRAIVDELGHVVFAAGRPEEFRKHHETTQAFIRSLECLAPSVHAIEAMRAHSVYVAFERRWQLPVYFQIRWKEIVGTLEDALAASGTAPRRTSTTQSDGATFVTGQAEAVWTAILTCWSAEVYIPELSYRFWKLTLQLLRRYKSWLDNNLPTFDSLPKTVHPSGAIIPEKAGTPPPAPPSEALSAETNAADDVVLRQLTAAIVDIKTMRTQMMAMWRGEIAMMLPETSYITEGETVNAEDALEHTLSSLTTIIPPMSKQIVAVLTRRCYDALLPVRLIPSQFRAMANKRSPSEPSYFVSSVLRPVKTFFAMGGVGDGPGASLQEEFMKAYANEIFEAVSQRYIYYLTAMRKTEESLRRLKKGKKPAFSLFGGNLPSRDEESRDEERIRTQMILDVNAFGKDAESLGVDVLACETFNTLNDMVHTSLTDESV